MRYDLHTGIPYSHNLSNISDDRKELFEKSIKEYKQSGGKLDVYIDDIATYGGQYGKEILLKNHFSVKTRSNSDHGEFWKYVRNMQRRLYPEEFI